MKTVLRGVLIGALALSMTGCVFAARQAYKVATGGHQHHRGARAAEQSVPSAAAREPGDPVILISIDGFRADYLDRGVTPNLKALADGGARAERMLPSFPSLTFPNHYTLVTGLVPDHHGIVNNTFEDPALPTGVFKLSNAAAITDRKSWDQATPIWVSAELAGIRTGTEFWPGSEADIQGVRPSLYSHYDEAVPSDQRVDKVLGWLDLPPSQRPTFMTLYFDLVDTAGHLHGPDSPEVNQAAATVDAAIGRLVTGLAARGVRANLVIVADHGMAYVALDHRVRIDDWVDPTSVRAVTLGSVAGIVPSSDTVNAKLVGRHPHADCYRKADIPARLHYGTNPRIPPVVCIAEVGWQITTAERDAKSRHPSIGEHGFDPAAREMGALFIANGPKFLAHVTLKPFPNTDVYPLLARLLDIEPLPNDGHVQDLYPALR